MAQLARWRRCCGGCRLNAATTTQFLRVRDIVCTPAKGDRPASRGLLSVSASHWHDGVRRGIYPKGIKLSPRVTVWRLEDVLAITDKASAQSDALNGRTGGDQ